VPDVNRRVRERIREIMEGRGLSQVDLARALGATKASVTGFLNPDRDMKLGTLDRIADALDHDLEVSLVPRGDEVSAPADGTRDASSGQ
jgi:transcriptional regulator with XRE-family HTH domain